MAGAEGAARPANVIDVTVVGGPDIGVRRDAHDDHGGVRLDLEVWNADPTPALLERVAVLIECGPPGRLVTYGWSGRDDPATAGPRDAPDVALPPGAERRGSARSHTVLVTDAAVVGWLSTGAHPGLVTAQQDGWLLTAWALLDGVVLAPGETRRLDPLWLGPGGDAGAAGHAAAWAGHLGAAPPPPAAGPVWCPSGPVSAGALAAAAGAGVGVAVVGADLAGAAAAAGLVPGALVSLARPWTAGRTDASGWARVGDGRADLTHPRAVEGFAALGAALGGAGVRWIVVDDGRDALAPASRWGDASAPVAASLRPVLDALRAAAGPDVCLQLADGPLGAVAGVVDVVEATPPVRDAAGAGPAGEALAARRAWAGRPWHLATGPLDPDAVAAAGDPGDLASASVVVVTGDPAAWSAEGRRWLARSVRPG